MNITNNVWKLHSAAPGTAESTLDSQLRRRAIIKRVCIGLIGASCIFGLNQLALGAAAGGGDASTGKTQVTGSKSASASSASTSATTSENSMSTASSTQQEKLLIATIETNLGTMKISLFYKETPITVSNFVTLINQGFYDGLIFHRVIKNFMIQGGDPKGNGTGGPGYSFQDEFVPSLKHSKKGILSMANAGPNSNGSQFFITLVPTPHLDGAHTVFGELIEGEDVLDKIGTTPTASMDRPVTPVVMKKVTVTGNFKPVDFKKNAK